MSVLSAESAVKDLRHAPRRTYDKVKPNLQLGQVWVPPAPNRGRSENSVSLVRAHGLQCGLKIAACLDLNKGQHRAASGNKIELPSPGSSASIQDTPACQL